MFNLQFHTPPQTPRVVITNEQKDQQLNDILQLPHSAKIAALTVFINEEKLRLLSAGIPLRSVNSSTSYYYHAMGLLSDNLDPTSITTFSPTH